MQGLWANVKRELSIIIDFIEFFFLHLSCMIRAKLLACPYLEYFKCIKEKFCLSRLSTDNLMLKKY